MELGDQNAEFIANRFTQLMDFDNLTRKRFRRGFSNECAVGDLMEALLALDAPWTEEVHLEDVVYFMGEKVHLEDVVYFMGEKAGLCAAMSDTEYLLIAGVILAVRFMSKPEGPEVPGKLQKDRVMEAAEGQLVDAALPFDQKLAQRRLGFTLLSWPPLNLKWCEDEDTIPEAGEGLVGQMDPVHPDDGEEWVKWIQFIGDDKVLRLDQLTMAQEMMLENGRPYRFYQGSTIHPIETRPRSSTKRKAPAGLAPDLDKSANSIKEAKRADRDGCVSPTPAPAPSMSSNPRQAACEHGDQIPDALDHLEYDDLSHEDLQGLDITWHYILCWSSEAGFACFTDPGGELQQLRQMDDFFGKQSYQPELLEGIQCVQEADADTYVWDNGDKISVMAGLLITRQDLQGFAVLCVELEELRSKTFKVKHAKMEADADLEVKDVKDEGDAPAKDLEVKEVKDERDAPAKDLEAKEVKDEGDAPAKDVEVKEVKDEGEDEGDAPAKDLEAKEVKDEGDAPAKDLEVKDVKDEGDAPAKEPDLEHAAKLAESRKNYRKKKNLEGKEILQNCGHADLKVADDFHQMLLGSNMLNSSHRHSGLRKVGHDSSGV
eukprot:s1226_g39.t1